MTPDWSVFDSFTRPNESWSWAAVDDWTAAFDRQLDATRARVARLRKASDKVLSDLGGDPTRTDWTTFRALRREREEDWSDWLAQLIEDSEQGWFSWSLLGSLEQLPRSAYCRAKVKREVAYDKYRADVIVDWSDGSYTHVEVKVGDRALAKTLETARRMESLHTALHRRSDVILILPSQLSDWSSACLAIEGMDARVKAITWLDVARATRSALRTARGESVRWRVWAHAFSGAIEQDLLGVRPGVDATSWSKGLSVQSLGWAAELLAEERRVS